MAPFLLQKYTHRRDRTKCPVCDFLIGQTHDHPQLLLARVHRV